MNEQIQAHLRRCGVGDRTAAVIATGPEDCQILRDVQAWVESKATFLLLAGDTGVGKTVAAATVLLEAVARWDGGQAFDASRGRFVKADDLCRMGYYDDETARRIQRLSDVPWLVLDDLGAELVTQPWIATLQTIVDRRHEARRRTVLTANLSAERFREQYGRRVVDRIRGDGAIIGCGAESRR